MKAPVSKMSRKEMAALKTMTLAQLNTEREHYVQLARHAMAHLMRAQANAYLSAVRYIKREIEKRA